MLQNTTLPPVYKFVLNNYQMILGINIGIMMITEIIFCQYPRKDVFEFTLKMQS